MYLFDYAFILSFIHPCPFAGREHKPAVAYFFTVLIYSHGSELVSVNLFGPALSLINDWDLKEGLKIISDHR